MSVCVLRAVASVKISSVRERETIEDNSLEIGVNFYQFACCWKSLSLHPKKIQSAYIISANSLSISNHSFFPRLTVFFSPMLSFFPFICIGVHLADTPCENRNRKSNPVSLSVHANHFSVIQSPTNSHTNTLRTHTQDVCAHPNVKMRRQDQTVSYINNTERKKNTI